MGGGCAHVKQLLAIGRAADPRFSGKVGAILAASVVAGFAELASIGAVVALIASAVGEKSVIPFLRLSTVEWATVFALLVAVAAASRLALHAYIQRQAVEVAHRIAVLVHANVLAQPYAWHVRQHSSALVTALHRVDELLYVVFLPLLQAIAATIVGIAIMVLLATTAWIYALVGAALLAVIYFGLSLWSIDALRRHGAAADAHYERQVRILQDGNDSIRDLIVRGRQAQFSATFAERSAALAAARGGKEIRANAPRFLVEAMGAIALAVALAAASNAPGGIVPALPTIALFAAAFARLLPLAQQIYRGWASLHTHRTVIEEIAAFTSLPPAQHRSAGPIPFTERFSLNDVHFTYPDGPTVLRGVTLSIAKGEWIGLTGASGSGKSTIGDLVSGLLDPCSGNLVVDGRALDPDDVAGWQAHLAMVSQAVFLSDDSVAENITFATLTADARAASQERIRHAAAIALLGHWIDSRPGGIDAPVGEAGKRISGGQRQRIGIARALASEAEVLILDEATNALDAATEAAILANIRRERPGLTVLLISHREAALAVCDRIYRIESGRVTVR